MDERINITVADVDYLGGYMLRLTFSNGEVKQIDMLPLLNGPIFEPLKDPHNFVQFALIGGTLEWYNGADFAPEYLYKHSK